MAKWIKFNYVGLSPTGKTKRWEVLTLEGTVIGHIKWHGPWRKYSFFPCFDTVFENDCLQDIIDFNKQAMAEKKAEN